MPIRYHLSASVRAILQAGYVRFIGTWAVTTVLVVSAPPESCGQGLKLLGIPLDTLLHIKIPRVDQSYITTYYGRLHFFLVSDRQDYALRLVGPSQSLLYKPNLAWALGVGFDYKWAGTELTVKLPFLGYNPVLKGKTKPFGISLNFNNRRLWVSGQYQFYRGFYVGNPDVVEPDWLSHHPMYPYRNDLISQMVVSHVQYLFNPLQVSIPASLLQREGQRKAAGSWVVGSFLTYQLIRADSSFVPVPLQGDFPDESASHRFRSLALGVDAGYIQTFVFGTHYFVNVSVRPGLSVLLEQNTRLAHSPVSHIRLGWQGLTSLTIGYNSSRYYGGIYASATLANRAFSGALVQTDVEYIRLVAGKRLRYKPKGLIKKVPGL